LPIRRLGAFVEVADFIGFLTSEATGYITGGDLIL